MNLLLKRFKNMIGCFSAYFSVDGIECKELALVPLIARTYPQYYRVNKSGELESINRVAIKQNMSEGYLDRP